MQNKNNRRLALRPVPSRGVLVVYSQPARTTVDDIIPALPIIRNIP